MISAGQGCLDGMMHGGGIYNRGTKEEEKAGAFEECNARCKRQQASTDVMAVLLGDSVANNRCLTPTP